MRGILHTKITYRKSDPSGLRQTGSIYIPGEVSDPTAELKAAGLADAQVISYRSVHIREKLLSNSSTLLVGKPGGNAGFGKGEI